LQKAVLRVRPGDNVVMNRPAPPAYDELGQGYAPARQPDPRIMQRILAALGGARTLLNVGAGAGSYEPAGLSVVAVEPSSEMIRQRHRLAAPCVMAAAEALPFPDASFDAGLAVLTIHHWSDLFRGLSEMKRVCRNRIVLLTCDISVARSFWMTERYLPEAIWLDEQRFPSIASLAAAFSRVTVEPVPIPHDCTDGFFGAHWKHPEAYLRPDVRAGISVLRQLPPHVVMRALAELERDLATGVWAYEVLRHLPDDSLDLGYRLVVGQLG
jgi:SAM-dependent methyltransferase